MEWHCSECDGECAEEQLTDGENGGIVCPMCGAEIQNGGGASL
jgi:DNA-directed RNA polymerase subunit RPC12/RpoP